MANQNDIDDFNRRSRSVGATVPIQEIPKLSEVVGSPDPTRLARMREFDRRMDEWRKSLLTTGVLGAAEKQAITTASVVAASSTPGPAGRDGLDGLNGLNGLNGIDGINGKDGADGAGSVPPDQLGLVQHVWIAFRTDGVPGTGSIVDPFDGSTKDKFDAVMMGLGTYTDIHIGPGVFETRGNRNNVLAGGWYAKEGQKITGSGIDVTVLQLVDCTDATWLYWIIGNYRFPTPTGADFIEVSDLTCDCNLRGQSGAVATGAVLLVGSFLRCRRVRAIDWGSKSAGRECFVISIRSNGAPGDYLSALVEGCLCDTPYDGVGAFSDNSTVLFAGTSGKDADDKDTFDFNGVVRGCVVDGTLSSGTLSPDRVMTAISVDGRGAPIVEDNLIINAGAGFYRDSWNARNILIRNNRFINVMFGILCNMGNALWLDYGLDTWARTYRAIVDVRSATTGGVTTVTVTTSVNHGFVVGNWVDLRGTAVAQYDGVWKLVTASGSSFTYVVPTGSYPIGSSGQAVKVDARAVTTLTKADGGVTGIVDAGVKHGVLVGDLVQIGGVTGPDAGAFNRDMGLVIDVTDNTFKYRLGGLAANDAPVGEKIWWDRSGWPPDPATPITSVGTLATVTTRNAHNYVVGDLIKVSGIEGSGSNSHYNGYFLIETVPSDHTFTYRMVGSAGESTVRARYTNIWTVRHLLIEDNYFELTGPPDNTGGPADLGRGIGLLAPSYSAIPYAALSIYENVVIRRNVVRLLDGEPNGAARNIALTVDHVRNLVCEDNLLDVVDPLSVTNRFNAYQPTVRLGRFRIRNNRNYAGDLLRCYENNSSRYYDEPERTFESVQLLQAVGF